ncbi:MAG: hypothetical protein CMLOHMNK_00848 [Steroidobacteraceae bacterium]|nr:hypothetical protein [Steroidobacteraceae bacterium]
MTPAQPGATPSNAAATAPDSAEPITPAAAPRAAPPATAVAAPSAERAGSASSVRYGVQFGAFSTEGKATADWKRLSKAHPDTLAGLTPNVTAVRSGANTLYRLRAATRSEAAARELCATLRARGQACVVVLPVGK